MRNRLYTDLANLFPVITPREHYREEAKFWSSILRSALGAGAHRILEMGVGGGHLLSYLRDDFSATAVDLSATMLALSKKLNPTVRHIQGDMRSLDLDEKFDAVLIHDAVSYLLSENDIRATAQTALTHLRAGGLLVMAPDYFKETFIPDRISSFTNILDDQTVTFIEHTWDPNPDDTEIEVNMFFLIKKNGKMIIEEDIHHLGLFQRDVWERILQETGFSVKWIPSPHKEPGTGGYLISAYADT